MNIAPTTAPAGFWKPWGEIEEKAPAEMKNPKLVRESVCADVAAHVVLRVDVDVDVDVGNCNCNASSKN
eukprot:g16101.t1